MDPVHQAANLSVGRGCGFAALAILTTTIGLAYHPAFALKIAGAMFLIAAAALIIKAERAHLVPYHRTEVWMMIAGREAVMPEVRQKMISGARRNALLRYAKRACALATFCILTGTALGLKNSG
jgi:uncharacterized membrane protein